jgi:G6PDH family F420-dependent oxidoreductase
MVHKLTDIDSLKISLDIGENEKDPTEFRDCVILADKLGFDSAWLGDHFMPWIHSGNKSAYVWSLMGACLEKTGNIKVGPFVTTPIGGRYHPAIIAQASATLDNMYPGRFLLSVGTGEALNEVPFFGNNEWPSWRERNDRLVEGIALMRKLWESPSYFDFEGKYFKMKQVFLYTKPKTDLEIYFSGIGPKSAYNAGRYADHLVTLTSHNSLALCKSVIFPSFERGARDAGKDPKRMEKVVSLSFTLEDKQSYLKSAKRTAGIIAKGSWNMADPRQIEAMGPSVSDEELLKSTYLCSNWEDVIEIISKFHEIGATEVTLFSGPNQDLIRTYAKKILTHFRKH